LGPSIPEGEPSQWQKLANVVVRATRAVTALPAADAPIVGLGSWLSPLLAAVAVTIRPGRIAAAIIGVIVR